MTPQQTLRNRCTWKGLALVAAMLMLGACSNSDYDAGVKLALNRHFTQALQQFLSSAKSGYTPAMIQLGNYYEHGIGVAVNMQKAEKWYRRAYRSGDENAILILGKFYLEQKQYTDAFHFLSKGLHTRDGETIYLLAQCHENGWGTRQDRNLAIKYYILSANLNYSAASLRLHKLGVNTWDSTIDPSLTLHSIYLIEYPATWFVIFFLNLMLLPLYARVFFDGLEDFGDHIKQLFTRQSRQERVELAEEGYGTDIFFENLKTLAWAVFYVAAVTAQYKLIISIFY